ncbi:MAG: AMP-binding protein, partial [Actinobacteria bacterium]|nr:AMP-binding protein [Actinomycetota bacterium]
LYTAPTAIRTFMKWGTQFPEDRDLSSLRVLGSVGEPINPEAWVWYWTHIGGGHCPVVDTWWQTETGAILIAPLPGATTLRPGSATFPLPGIGAEVVDEQGKPVAGGGGYLTLTRPWPSMLRGIYRDPERYHQTYWSRYEGRYFAGDGAKIDGNGYFWLLGRVDDVMNISGHRVSTTEVESALVDHPSVAEAAVVGAKDDTTGQAIIAFVTLKGDQQPDSERGEALRRHVTKRIGAIARPKTVIFTDDLPKTRSGKIMRRLLRDVAEGRDLGDTTTLADAGVVEEIRQPPALPGRARTQGLEGLLRRLRRGCPHRGRRPPARGARSGRRHRAPHRPSAPGPGLHSRLVETSRRAVGPPGDAPLGRLHGGLGVQAGHGCRNPGPGLRPPPRFRGRRS